MTQRDGNSAALVARPSATGWRIASGTDAENAAIFSLGELERAAAEAGLNARIAKLEERVSGFDIAWQQELAITAAREASVSLYAADKFAELAAGEPCEWRIEGLDHEISRFAIARAFERRGLTVASGNLANALRCRLARLLAMIWLLVLAIRALGWPRFTDGGAKVFAAMHAEDANRTQHMRKALANLDPATGSVLFVGRPHLSREAAARMLRDAGWNGDWALAWDWRSAVSALPKGWRICGEGARATAAAGFAPQFSSLVSIMLRILIGSASAARWQADVPSARDVIFAHEGRADTVLLERAVQRGGGRTVHWMHGLTTGKNFQGVSDLCVLQCEHDARWHDAICNYRRNVSFPASGRTPFHMGERPGSTVLTNFTHPAYPPFVRIGPAHELALIDMVAEAAHKLGVAPAQVRWKPHPTFYTGPEAVRETVRQALDAAGFELWPSQATDFEQALASDVLIATPSGVALDLLARGRLPVMTELFPVDPAHALATFRPRASNADELVDGIALARDEVRAAAAFSEIQQALGPGRVPEWAEMLSALN